MQVERHVVTVTTDSGGDATEYTPPITGRILAIHYVKPGSGNFDDGVDFTITSEATGETIWAESNVNASASRAPRMATHSTAGAAALYAAAGMAVLDRIALARDRIKVVIAQGGSVKTGTFHFIVG